MPNAQVIDLTQILAAREILGFDIPPGIHDAPPSPWDPDVNVESFKAQDETKDMFVITVMGCENPAMSRNEAMQLLKMLTEALNGA